MSTTTELLEPSLLEVFDRDGYVVVPDILDVDELDCYGALVTDAVRARNAGDDIPLEEKSRYQQSFIQCMNLWEDHPEVRPLTFHPRLGQAAAELLGVPAIRLWHDQALYKQAGGRPTDAHQDHPYWPIKETPSVTAWIPFEGSTLASGALGYLPGTHKIGMRKFINIFFGEPDDILAHPEVAGIDPVFVEVPKGAVAFHHGLTVHLAKANTTDRGYPNAHFAVDRAGIEVGAPIGDGTPIVWPRPAGDLPEPPAVALLLTHGIANKGPAPS